MSERTRNINKPLQSYFENKVVGGFLSRIPMEAEELDCASCKAKSTKKFNGEKKDRGSPSGVNA